MSKLHSLIAQSLLYFDTRTSMSAQWRASSSNHDFSQICSISKISQAIHIDSNLCPRNAPPLFPGNRVLQSTTYPSIKPSLLVEVVDCPLNIQTIDSFYVSSCVSFVLLAVSLPLHLESRVDNSIWVSCRRSKCGTRLMSRNALRDFVGRRGDSGKGNRGVVNAISWCAT